MGLEGFSNNASGGMSPGDHLYAKTFNKLATSADKAQVGPSDGVLFTANNGGVGMYIPQPPKDPVTELLQQFQIVVEPYFIMGEDTGLFIIRVVKGEVVWSPKLLEVPGVPMPPVCTTQTTIENWFALPSFPVIDDDNAIFIGDGGIRVPKSEIPIGIFIFKATNLPIDPDPIIVACPDFAPSCPVAFPGTPPVAGAFWEMVKIGSVVYIEPDPEADPPIEGGWEITQNFIGSMTLPGSGKSDPTGMLPAQLGDSGGRGAISSPFECWISNVNGFRYLQIATGSVSYSSSAMPMIKDGAFTHIKQAWFNKVQICGTGSRASYNDIYPNPYYDPDPSFSNQMMEGGGGYRLFDTNDPVVIYAFKWDAGEGIGSSAGAFIKGGLPTIGIFAQTNPTDIAKITKDCGPTVYEQTMNIQPMTGYKAEDTELAGDWGHCHTTWLNPRKIGYNYKAIATIISKGAGQFYCYIGYEQTGIPMVCNTIQYVNMSDFKDVMAGAIVFSYNFISSPIPFPVIWDYATGTVGPDALNLFRSLNAIPELTGNVQVSGANGYFYVTFVNKLQGLPISLITANTAGVLKYQNSFEIIQYHTGNLDLTTPMQMGMTQLMNVEDQKEVDDPYNKNADSNPPWKDIINKADCLACKDFAGDVTTEGVYSLSGFTDNNPSLFIAGGCTGDVCVFPFQVHSIGIVNDSVEFTVCSGMVNNIIPQGIDASYPLNDGYIYLEVWYDSAGKVFPDPDNVYISTGSSIPQSDTETSYIAIAQIVEGKARQLISGSLWGDRIQVGSGETQDAYYYYAQV